MRFTHFKRKQIGVWEIAVVLRILFRAHHIAFALGIIPAAGLLFDTATLADDLDLPLRLILDGAVHRAEAVDVFHLGSSAEFLLSAGTHRDVHVCAHTALLHLGV